MADLKFYKYINVQKVRERWADAEEGRASRPWYQPPQIGHDEITALMVLTANYLMVELPSYKDFYRLMVRDGQLKLVMEDGIEFPILELYFATDTVKERSGFLRMLRGPEKALTSNLLDFKKK